MTQIEQVFDIDALTPTTIETYQEALHVSGEYKHYGRMTLTKGLELGRILNELRPNIPYGQWLPCVQTLSLTPKIAQYWMRCDKTQQEMVDIDHLLLPEPEPYSTNATEALEHVQSSAIDMDLTDLSDFPTPDNYTAPVVQSNPDSLVQQQEPLEQTNPTPMPIIQPKQRTTQGERYVNDSGQWRYKRSGEYRPGFHWVVNPHKDGTFQIAIANISPPLDFVVSREQLEEIIQGGQICLQDESDDE